MQKDNAAENDSRAGEPTGGVRLTKHEPAGQGNEHHAELARRRHDRDRGEAVCGENRDIRAGRQHADGDGHRQVPPCLADKDARRRSRSQRERREQHGLTDEARPEVPERGQARRRHGGRVPQRVRRDADADHRAEKHAAAQPGGPLGMADDAAWAFRSGRAGTAARRGRSNDDNPGHDERRAGQRHERRALPQQQNGPEYRQERPRAARQRVHNAHIGEAVGTLQHEHVCRVQHGAAGCPANPRGSGLRRDEQRNRERRRQRCGRPRGDREKHRPGCPLPLDEDVPGRVRNRPDEDQQRRAHGRGAISG